jgi:hypothetical protein
MYCIKKAAFPRLAGNVLPDYMHTHPRRSTCDLKLYNKHT